MSTWKTTFCSRAQSHWKAKHDHNKNPLTAEAAEECGGEERGEGIGYRPQVTVYGPQNLQHVRSKNTQQIPPCGRNDKTWGVVVSDENLREET